VQNANRYRQTVDGRAVCRGEWRAVNVPGA
jgi:hypothetical protein